MKAAFYRQPHAGFTLIELMIVVGIIGILVSIAAPNFARYQSKARQSEAKIALAATYGAEKSFYSEYSAYAGSMEAIGYTPEGQRRFYTVGFATIHSGTINGYAGGLTVGSWHSTLNPYTGCGTAGTLGTQLSADSQDFTVAATACIRQGQTAHDVWNIQDDKVLSNNVRSL